MKYGIYTIRDCKTGYLPLTIDINDASAMRNFEHASKNPDSLFFTHCSDYDLCRIGSFDTDSGLIELENLTVICSGVSLSVNKIKEV